MAFEFEQDKQVAGVAVVEPATGRVLGVLEFLSRVEEIFDRQVLPTSCRVRSALRGRARPSCSLPGQAPNRRNQGAPFACRLTPKLSYRCSQVSAIE